MPISWFTNITFDFKLFNATRHEQIFVSLKHAHTAINTDDGELRYTKGYIDGPGAAPQELQQHRTSDVFDECEIEGCQSGEQVLFPCYIGTR